MEVVAITKLKHNGLHQALKTLKWTQLKLAEESGIPQHRICAIINLLNKPRIEEILKIAEALEKHGFTGNILEDWPDEFMGFEKRPVHETIRDITIQQLSAPQWKKLIAPNHEYEEDIKEFVELCKDSIKHMPRRYGLVLEQQLKGASLEEIGVKFNVTKERIRQILMRLQRELRRSLHRESYTNPAVKELYGKVVGGDL